MRLDLQLDRIDWMNPAVSLHMKASSLHLQKMLTNNNKSQREAVRVKVKVSKEQLKSF